MAAWGLITVVTCPLSSRNQETHDHLFPLQIFEAGLVPSTFSERGPFKLNLVIGMG